MPNSDVFYSSFAHNIAKQRYLWDLKDGTKETWAQLAHRVAKNVMGAVDAPKEMVSRIEKAIANREFVPGGRYLYASGRPYKQTQNCLLLRAQDSREGWAELLQKSSMALMTGAGIGVVYSDVREKGQAIRKTGGVSSGPLSLAKMLNEVGREVRQGGERRSAIWAGLHWWHPDVMEFVHAKDWSPEVRALKAKDFNFPASLDMTNVSVILDDDFFAAYNNAKNPQHTLATTIYWEVLRQALKKGEPGFSVDTGANSANCLRNACCEVTSDTSDDICNIGSINMSRVRDLEHMKELVELGIQFLLAGSVYSDVPYPDVDKVRTKNRLLGLGLMGLHEWLLVHGKVYGPDAELEEYLKIYATSTDVAGKWAKQWKLSKPKRTRAIAPNGCQRPDTLVVTGDGILELGELGRVNGEKWQQLGVSVAQERSGSVSRASRFFVNGVAATKKITLSSGMELESTLNHQYRVLSNGEYLWKRADSLAEQDLLVVALDTYHKTTEPALLSIRKNYPTENTLRCPPSLNPELAWFLGVFFADGSMHGKGIRIACNAKENDYLEVARRGQDLFGVQPSLENNGRNCMYVCFNSQCLLRWLYTNGLDKHMSTEMEIPAIIRCASRAALQSFLDGYWFGDGSESAVYYIDTVSRKMAGQLVAISRALGTDASINKHVSGMGSMMYRINFVKTKRRAETKSVTQQLNALGLANCTVDQVVSVVDSESMTVDIEVPETATYLAGGVVSHNTTGIVSETTGGCEPIFAVAYKRRYYKGHVVHYEYVVDPVARRLIESGVKPEAIEDAYALAETSERRVGFQAWLQQYVDHGISSTVNLPPWGTQNNNDETVRPFGDMLMRYLPKLRGLTTYPDGARDGQPLNVVNYHTAVSKVGTVFVEEQADLCSITNRGSCGA